MNNDIRAALLGDKEAAKRLTDAGVLLPCPICGENIAKAASYAEHEFTDEDEPGYKWASTHFAVACNYNAGGCGACTGPSETLEGARLAWNTRAPVLSAEEIQKLEGNT